MKMNTIRQFSRNMSRRDYNRSVQHNQSHEETNLISKKVLHLIALTDTGDRDSYLEWVSVWKKVNHELVDQIRHYKKMRQELVNSSADVEKNLDYARFLATALYNQRDRMKLVSYWNKLSNIED